MEVLGSVLEDEIYFVFGVVFKVQSSGFRVQGSGFRIQGSGFRVQGLGFRVEGLIEPLGLRVGGLPPEEREGDVSERVEQEEDELQTWSRLDGLGCSPRQRSRVGGLKAKVELLS